VWIAAALLTPISIALGLRKEIAALTLWFYVAMVVLILLAAVVFGL
jgi:hypothetical protein